MLHTVLLDRQEVQLHTILTLYCRTLNRQTDRQEVQLHTILTLYCCTLYSQTGRRYSCTQS